MRVLLAGYNVDAEALSGLGRESDTTAELTPETISAAYARISRRKEPVDELRAEARTEVEKARKSNRTIVFGYGHASIAEHAVFNFDIIDISRLAVEELETHRLASFTEKSQRYVRLGSDFVIPKGVHECGMEQEFKDFMYELANTYSKIATMLDERFKETEGKEAANEDARYALPLAASTQVGMTVNARTLENMIVNLSSSKLEESRTLASKLYEAAYSVAPSLLRHTEPTAYRMATRKALEHTAESVFAEFVQVAESNSHRPSWESGDVRLVAATPDADTLLVASILHSSSKMPMSACMAAASSFREKQKQAILLRTFEHMQQWDPTLREFEFADFTFEITISAAAFGQLKRHRMSTQTWQGYDSSLGITVPPRIREAGAEDLLQHARELSERMYERLLECAPDEAEYALINAHRRRVLVKMNARELYHLSRLRCDAHAQWDIRNIARSMIKLATEVAPYTMMLAGGKDEFDAIYSNFFPPKED